MVTGTCGCGVLWDTSREWGRGWPVSCTPLLEPPVSLSPAHVCPDVRAGSSHAEIWGFFYGFAAF